MLRQILLFLGCSLFLVNLCQAEKVVWSGKVNSNGNPTAPIPLELHKQYQIKVTGFVNLGKWKQGGKKLANDACYEFIADKVEGGNREITKLESFQNSDQISVCDGRYFEDHVYTSKPFQAKQTKIHFWVYDTNYEDNYGSFDVEVLEVDAF